MWSMQNDDATSSIQHDIKQEIKLELDDIIKAEVVLDDTHNFMSPKYEGLHCEFCGEYLVKDEHSSSSANQSHNSISLKTKETKEKPEETNVPMEGMLHGNTSHDSSSGSLDSLSMKTKTIVYGEERTRDNDVMEDTILTFSNAKGFLADNPSSGIGLYYTNSNSLTQSGSSSSGDANTLQCGMCPFTCSQMSILQTHKNNIHNSDCSYVCRKCTQKLLLTCKFSQISNSIIEQTLVTVAKPCKPFKCDVCTYAAVYKYNLVIHTRKHRGEKPFMAFKCDECPYVAAFKSQLVMHTRKHTGEKPFKCNYNICTYATAHKGDLVVHTRMHTGEKPFKCDECPYTAASKSHLLLHTKHHAREDRPFKCTMCSFAASRSCYIVTHAKTHLVKTSFSCDVCSFTTSWKSDLIAHTRSHSRTIKEPSTLKM